MGMVLDKEALGFLWDEIKNLNLMTQRTCETIPLTLCNIYDAKSVNQNLDSPTGLSGQATRLPFPCISRIFSITA